MKSKHVLSNGFWIKDSKSTAAEIKKLSSYDVKNLCIAGDKFHKTEGTDKNLISKVFEEAKELNNNSKNGFSNKDFSLRFTISDNYFSFGRAKNLENTKFDICKYNNLYDSPFFDHGLTISPDGFVYLCCWEQHKIGDLFTPLDQLFQQAL